MNTKICDFLLGLEKNDDISIFNLANCYNNGKGVKQSFEKAFWLYQEAARLNNVKAMFNVALCYKNGKGVKQNLEKAFEWYKKSSALGNKPAMINKDYLIENKLISQ